MDGIINEEEICCICFENISIPFKTDCNHLFCKKCIDRYKETTKSVCFIDPCIYGAPRCPCNNLISCLNRPCNSLDNDIMKEWENNNPIQYREWTIEECTNKDISYKEINCPLCRGKLNI